MQNNTCDKEKVRIGLIGAGQIGGFHLDGYEKIKAADVLAVADVDEEKAKNVAEKYGIEHVYSDYRELLENEEVEAVDVCVHNNLHAPIVIGSLEAGKEVFSEKPLAGSYFDARRMYEKAKEEGRHLSVQNLILFSKETRAAKKLIEDRKLGEVYYGKAANFDVVGFRRRSIPYVEGYGSPNFVKKKVSGGGTVYDVGTYTIGQTLYLLGLPEVKRISGRTFQNAEETFEGEELGDIYKERLSVPPTEEFPKETEYDVEDVGFGFVRLEDDIVLSFGASWNFYLNGEGSAVVGTKGGIRLDPFQYFTTISDVEADVTFDLDEYERRRGLLEGREGENDDNLFSPPLRHWIGVLRGKEEPLPTAEIALKTMLIMEGIYMSNDLGREVSAEEVMEKSESTALET
ncbi:hypothetical protein AKJ57_01980 [candidate division MSBL1 archaeon SCGC-AAA259A05]|uniref:Oxidoreductase n=1 Tax=candidate division MSBL1 archaeon SCGC-AAA259A05 TaxID=1698259 RepID=A0A133UAL3_9EURY|nr:hypothetical protein AKJ57_01980 [candidate division MSBL1 archaeon SCGC-AAA259A05]